MKAEQLRKDRFEEDGVREGRRRREEDEGEEEGESVESRGRKGLRVLVRVRRKKRRVDVRQKDILGRLGDERRGVREEGCEGEGERAKVGGGRGWRDEERDKPRDEERVVLLPTKRKKKSDASALRSGRNVGLPPRPFLQERYLKP